MKQIDFGQWFCQKKYRKINYQLRFDGNLFHDFAYLQSYLGDAELFLDKLKYHRKGLSLEFERHCDECTTLGENRTVSCLLKLYPVYDFAYTFSGKKLEAYSLPAQISVTSMLLIPNDDKSGYSFLISNFLFGFKMEIFMKGDFPKICLRDYSPCIK